jgi:hypothetical protein
MLIVVAAMVGVTRAQPGSSPKAGRPQTLTIGSSVEEVQLANEVRELLSSRCSRCHGGSNGKNANLDMTNPASLVELRGEPGSGRAAVVPRDPDKSIMLERIETGLMPPEGSPEAQGFPSSAADLVKRWISAGAPWPGRQVVVRGFAQDLAAIRTHLLESAVDERPFLRYFTLSHLYNNAAISESDLRLYRAALSKTLNSLHWNRELVIPQVLPQTDNSVFVVNLKKLGWDRLQWESIKAANPHGLSFRLARQVDLQKLAHDVEQLSGGESLVAMRVDTFIATVTQPDLYHSLLDLPATLGELETRLGVNRLKNIELSTETDRRVWRGGFASSGVSRQNRLVERHELPQGGYYWLSYDFKPRNPRGNLLRFPFGPPEAQISRPELAFLTDGGEAIFTLPCGLQAYFLVDGAGQRINTGPVDVVFDRAAITGTPLISNGVSCMNCHSQGMIEFGDEIRESVALGPAEQGAIRKLYPPQAETQAKVLADRERFLAGLTAATQRFLCVEENSGKKITEFREPIGFVVDRYNTDLGPSEVAFELGLPGLDDLLNRVKVNRELTAAGLGPLTQSPPGTVKRDNWDSGAFATSIRALQLGYDTISTSFSRGARPSR